MSVSVIVYCYKNQNYLDQAFVTLANQEGCDWEAIIINDGCCFSIEPHLKPLADKSVKIVKFSKPQGMLVSLVTGLAMSRYKMCIFQRGCDFNLARRLVVQSKMLSRIGVDSVFSIPKILTERGIVNLPSESLVGGDASAVISELSRWRNMSLCVSGLMFNKCKLGSGLFKESSQNDSLCPSRVGTELFLMRELCGKNMIVCRESLAVVNCKKDVCIFERDDYGELNPSNSSNQNE